jgi:hypothetical protein
MGELSVPNPTCDDILKPDGVSEAVAAEEGEPSPSRPEPDPRDDPSTHKAARGAVVVAGMVV